MRAIALVSLGLALVAGCDASKPVNLDSEEAKVNYSIGYQIGNDFKNRGLALSDAELVAGIHDAIGGGEPRLDEKARRAALTEFGQRLVKAEKEKRSEQAGTNLEAARAFLEANRAKEGVQTLPSGLQYKILTEGKGPKPAASDVVTVNYRGTLIDGTEFDSSYSRNQPASFPVNRVIKGWTEALQLMGEGAKWELYVPPDLAYGETGAGDRIPPQSALVFEVELIKAKQK